MRLGTRLVGPERTSSHMGAQSETTEKYAVLVTQSPMFREVSSWFAHTSDSVENHFCRGGG